MSVIAEYLIKTTLGAPQTSNNLSVFPLISERSSEPSYSLLDQALADGSARVTEISESGSVPELKFLNEGDRPVFLLDGEELIGAKQNRIVNLSILAPASQAIVVPVSCVEAGRWHSNSREFASADRAYFSKGRAKKAAQVSASLRMAGSRRSNQSEVWADISQKAASMNAFSDTQAASALYETHRTSLNGYLEAFSATANQSGALFAINDEVVGLDLFDSPSTLNGLLPKLVRSYALDAIDTNDNGARPAEAEARSLLNDAADATAERFPAVGEGEDVRLAGEQLSGGALIADDRVVHLCVFRLRDNDGARPANDELPLLRPSLHRRRRI